MLESIDILVMELDLKEDQIFHFQVMDLVKIFGVDMNSSTHIDKKKKDILVLKKGPIQGLEHTLTTEKMYSTNFTVTKGNFVSACITTE